MKQLTFLQQKVFNFICEFAKTNGFPPSYSDISAHFNFSSDGTVRTYLEHLEKKGYIQRLGGARGIKILQTQQEDSIPILGKIAAGQPLLAQEDQIGTLNDIDELHYAENRFALHVKGDSMKDAGILNGDIAIIQKGVPVHNGQIAAIMIDNEATLKRLYFEKDKIRLQPENEFYDPIYIDRNTGDTAILGRYIALIRKV